MGEDAGEAVSAGEGLLRSLADHGVRYVFANLGTDHAPLLEAHARLADAGALDAIPEVVVTPHEFAAVSAAHGYAAATGEPQAVLVHVDVGTLNAGAALHNAHRANVPVFVLAGLAPVSEGGEPGARDHPIHWAQDVSDQTGAVREYCRWTAEYRPPADPDAVVTRGLERARAPPAGPVYCTATREALEATVERTGGRTVRAAGPGAPPGETVDAVAGLVADAAAPLVVTSHLGAAPDAADRVAALVDFVEAAGAGVVEANPTCLNAPRGHARHVGFAPEAVLGEADLVVLAATDVPWVPARGGPRDDATVVQIDPEPSKAHYPHWDYPVDRAVAADPAATLGAVAEHLDGPTDDPWPAIVAERRAAQEATLADHRADGRFTAAVCAAELGAAIDEATVVLDDAVTSSDAVLAQVDLDRPGSYLSKGGAGLGWAPGAAVGVKLARPDTRPIAVVGDGAYVFSNPTASAWLAASQSAPVLTVVLDNGGWNAVRRSTLAQHPDGAVADRGVLSERFEPALDLSAPATAVDAYTAVAADAETFRGALAEAVAAVDAGRPAVLVARIEPA